MDATLDDLYLEWLYSQVASVKEKRLNKSYWSLFRQLYKKEFVWIVPNDDNRVEDGRDLRREFIDSAGIRRVDRSWHQLGCSVLEMLIALSIRMEFETDKPIKQWFWELLENLKLDKCVDFNYNQKVVDYVDTVLDTLIWRTYDPNGFGGLFPLEHSSQDQRQVEIWYQASAYLLEHEWARGG